MKRQLRSSAVFFLLIFVLSAIVRISYLFDFASLPLFGQVCGPDVSEYFLEAQKICAGQWLPQEVLIHAPLYPYLLALFLKISGGEIFLVRLMQGLLCSLLLLLPVFLMLRRRTAGIPSLRFLPYAATLLLGIYPPLAIYQCEFFSENLMMILLTWSLWSFTLHRKYADGLAGVLGGLAVLAHPGCIFYLPLSTVYAWFRLKNGRCARLFRLGSLLFGMILVIAPVSVRNSLLARRPVLIQDNSMFNLVLGNSRGSTGTCRIPPGIRWEKEFERGSIGAARQGITVEEFYRNEFLQYILHHPGHYLLNLGRKAAMALSAREFTTWSDATALKLIVWHRYFYQNWFLLLLLLGGPVLLLGIFCPAFRRFMSLELLLFFAIFAGQVFFLTSGRYRLPLVIPLAVFAGYFLCRPLRFLETPRRSIMTLGSMFLLYWIGTYPYSVPQQMERDYARSLLASAYIRAGKPAEAVKIYEPAAAGECFPDRKLTILGQAWYALGDLKKAGQYYRKAVTDYPYLPEGYLNYASVLSETGSIGAAEKWLAAALKLHPKGKVLADIEYNLGEIAQRTNRPETAEKHYCAALAVQPAHRQALNNLGTLYIRRKEPEKAVPLFRKALLLEPESVRLRVNLAVSLAMSGQEAEARKIVVEAIHLDPNCLPARKLLEALPPEKR